MSSTQDATTYQVVRVRGYSRNPALLAGAFAPLTVLALVNSEWAPAFIAGAMVLFGGITAVGRATQGPFRAVLDDAGVTLGPPVDVVAWRDLAIVSMVQTSRGGIGPLAWVRYDGSIVQTPSTFVDLHRLLSDVQGRAPQVEVTTTQG